MLRYLAFATLLAAAVAMASFLVGVWFPLLPSPVLAAILFVCPSYSFFAATAACEPFDACSLNMLAWVVAANVALFCLLATTLWFTRQRLRPLRFAVFALVAAASAWWVSQWV
jgi:hypothetical protein